MKLLLPFCNKSLGVSLAGVLLLNACSSTPPRSEVTESEPAPASEKAEAVPEKLPRAYDKALVLMQTGNYQAAIPVLKQFIEERPQLAGPYLNLGIAYQRTAQSEAALNALNKAIELNPASAPAHQQLGILYREQGDFKAAREAYSRALDLNSDYALAHRNLGILYDLYLQQPGMALEHYKKYLELAEEPDPQVNGWVVDLERRSGTAQASVTR